jgi:hypothetical protein
MAPTRPPMDIRCGCGRLLARRTERGIEIKCRRCDRVTQIRLEALPGDGRFVDLGRDGSVLGE